MTTKLDGLEESTAIFDSLPEAVQDGLVLVLAAIGRDGVALQRALVPTRSGALKSALDFTASLEALRLRVGLTDLKRRRDLWYAIIVEYGRQGGSKRVSRRHPGQGRKSRAKAAASTYLARWTSLPAKPFVHIEGQVDRMADAALADFWDRVLARAEG